MPKPAQLADRTRAVALVDAYIRGGLEVAAACLRAGVARACYYRWKQETTQEAKQAARRGRPTKLELTTEEKRRLRYWRLIRASVPEALREFMADPVCRPETAQTLEALWQRAQARRKRPSWPLSVRRALHVTRAERGLLRGEKAHDETVATERRGAFWCDEEGREWPLSPTTIYESDDESENEPFRYVDAATGEERLGRQSLKTISSFSLKWLGFTHVGRERDAYRVEDIADHFADIVRCHGLPILWRVERGVWDNQWLFGVKLQDGSRWGGLDGLFHIRQKHRSRGKANVEGSFNHAQNLRAHGADGGVMSLGRKRGEFEAATKDYLRAQAGHADALAKFWSIEESAAATAAALSKFNAQPKERHIFGGQWISPDEAHGTPAKREVPADQWWRFLPVKKAASVRRGVIEIRAPHYPVSFRFRVNGAEGMRGIHLDQGHKVLVAFHPGHPEQGLHVFNAEMGAMNREHWTCGQALGVAEWMPDRPQEDLSGRGDFSNAKRERAAVRREFREIVAGTARASRKSHAQDGLGNVIRQAMGATGPTPGAAAKATRGGLILPEAMPPAPPARSASTASELAEQRLREREAEQACLLV